MAEDSYTLEEESYEDEELDETSFKSVKDAVLFAIDISSSMLTPRPSPDPKKHSAESPASAALKCAYHLMQQRIISNPRDMIGVLLYGTKSSKFYDENEEDRGNLSYPHCYLYTDLDVPSAQEVKHLRSLASPAGADDDVRQVLEPSKEPVSMANMLFCANQIFTSKAPNFSSRRLFVVTDNDNPHADNKGMRSAATVRARDLYDLGVNIELFPISQPDHEFDTSKFYDDIIYKTSPSDGDAPAYLQPDTNASTAKGDGLSLLNCLLCSINSRSVPRRSLFSNVPLEIGPDFTISVNGYLLLKKQEPARSCFVWQGGETAQIAKGIQVWRSFGDPVIRIIGFKSLSALPIWANVKHPSFIYPSEENYIGSTRVFSALQQKLLDSEKLALVWFIPRKNASPVLAAMIAGAEKIDENGVQKIPPGMWIIPLPFADDVRQNPESTVNRAGDALNDAMRDVVRQLQLPKAVYEPSKYPNPSLQWHYRILQAIALDEDFPESPDDKTVPKYRQIHKRAGDYILKWAEELKLQASEMFGSSVATSTLVKRDAKSEPAGEHPSKRVKVEDSASGVEHEVKKCYEKGTVSKLTVVVLKEFLHSHGRATAGKKADLIDRVEQYFEKKF
ncbi:Ku seventy [Penicillium digitatum]|uniref:ATP-dependent DNA helicase II subunit 1 n=1 Tax=Penicillium digitatum TaxID=36651 RepID=A0A7T7BKI3_PENDI|nr:Ku seventy [Penicillium digitatum]